MRTKRAVRPTSVWKSILASAALLPLIAALAPASTSHGAPTVQHDRVLFSIPVGSQLSYADGESTEPWGPAGIVVADDGTVWIADGASHRVVGFDMSGQPRGTIDVSSKVVGIGGLATHGSNLVVLDAAAPHPAVVVVDTRSGHLVKEIPLPPTARLESGLSGVATEPDGTIVAQLEGGTQGVSVGNVSTASRVTAGDSLPTTVTHTGAGTIELAAHTDWRQPLTVRINDNPISIEAPGREIAGQIAGATKSQVFMRVVESSQAAPTGEILVDSTVKMFDNRGVSTGEARIPKGSMIRNSKITISPQGAIIALIADTSAVSVVELGVVPPGTLNEAIPELPEPEQILRGENGKSLSACVSRTTMAARDEAYRSNRKALSATNISGACTGRAKPRYLGAAGTYSSVPYKWGGFDTVASFNSHMSPQTGRAGDISTGSSLTCAYGVDCSGFVSRVWGLSSKYGTSTLPQVSGTIPRSWLMPFDVFNKSGHVMFYRSKTTSGYYVSEATTMGSMDRVVYQFHDAAYADGFVPRRYTHVCLTCTPKDPCP